MSLLFSQQTSLRNAMRQYLGIEYRWVWKIFVCLENSKPINRRLITNAGTCHYIYILDEMHPTSKFILSFRFRDQSLIPVNVNQRLHPKSAMSPSRYLNSDQ